jgi:hypothetical protein
MGDAAFPNIRCQRNPEDCALDRMDKINQVTLSHTLISA